MGALIAYYVGASWYLFLNVSRIVRIFGVSRDY